MNTPGNTYPSPTDYNDIEYLALLADVGKLLQEAQRIFAQHKGVHDTMWLANIPVMYEEECVGYFTFEDGWVNYHKAERIKETK